jgi:hypothetical protein
VWNPAVTRSPATDIPQSDAEQLGDTLLREAELAEYLAAIAAGPLTSM